MKRAAMILPFLFHGALFSEDLSEARQRYYVERQKIERKYEEELADLAKKFFKTTERGTKVAMRAKDFDRAMAWKEWEQDLRNQAFSDPTGGYKNIAQQSSVSHSTHVERTWSRKDHLCDSSDDSLLMLGDVSRQEIPCINFQLKTAHLIGAVRMVVPDSNGEERAGHEPFEYAVLIYNGKHLVNAVKVIDGRHADRKTVKHKKNRALITVPIEPTFGDRVEFKCWRTSGGSTGPVIYEFEIMGR